MIQDKKMEQVIPVISYKPPKLSIMPCGHDEKYAVHEEEGTSWCVMCEYKATSEIIEKLRNVLQVSDELNMDLLKSSPLGNSGANSRRRRISEGSPAAYML
jgi:hypothetical protein